MSFSVEFNANSVEDAREIVAQEYLPDSVRTFIIQALSAFSNTAVYVKAYGHLCNNDFQNSGADIKVQPITFKYPKV